MVALLIVLLAVLGEGTSFACVGAACLDIFSTANGGALTIRWDFNQRLQTYQSFCVPDHSQCLYSAIDPGFMALTADDDASDSYYVLADNTTVRIVIVSADAAV